MASFGSILILELEIKLGVNCFDTRRQPGYRVQHVDFNVEEGQQADCSAIFDMSAKQFNNVSQQIL